MALIVEIVEITEDIFKVKTTQIADEENNADWELVQQIEDQRSAAEFERLEIRDTLRVLLEKTPLAPREREVINLFLSGTGIGDWSDIAKYLKITRSNVSAIFRRAAKKLRKTATELGIAP
jgi:DNA-directed RNA polymerase specialized sigma subunit